MSKVHNLSMYEILSNNCYLFNNNVFHELKKFLSLLNITLSLFKIKHLQIQFVYNVNIANKYNALKISKCSYFYMNNLNNSTTNSNYYCQGSADCKEC